MKYLIICLVICVQLGCSSVRIKDSNFAQIPFCHYLHMPVGIADRLLHDEKGLGINCPDIDEVPAVSDVAVLPYAPLQARIVGMIIVKKGVSYDPYCRTIGANIIVKWNNDFINNDMYDIYEAYYSEK